MRANLVRINQKGNMPGHDNELPDNPWIERTQMEQAEVEKQIKGFEIGVKVKVRNVEQFKGLTEVHNSEGIVENSYKWHGKPFVRVTFTNQEGEVKTMTFSPQDLLKT